jgi:CBS domain-containing protein
MKLKDVMTHDVEVLNPHDSVMKAARKMKTLDVGSLPICDNNKILGMLTDRDITVRVVAEGRDPAQTHAHDVMSPEVVWCYDDQDVKEAAQLMADHQIRRLPVVNRDKQLVGIVSLGDLAVHAKNDRMTGDTLEEVSEPAEPKR